VLAVRVTVAVGLTVGLETVAVGVPVAVSVASLELRGVAEQRDEDDACDRHVVLEGVEEEEESAEQREQREREAWRQRIAEQQTEAADAGGEDHAEHEARVELAEKVPGPDDLAASATVPDAVEGVSDVVGRGGDACQAKIRVALGLGEGGIVERVGHSHDAMPAIRRGDHDAQTAGEVEGHQPRGLALDRID